MRRRRPRAVDRRLVRADPIALGALGAVVLALGVYAIFTLRVPFVHGYRVEAVFSSSNQLRKNAPVRIAGVDVGKVAGFHRGPGHTTAVTMEIADRGRPVHRDATARIRPRLFLEGGFYVDLQPGSPSAPELASGGTIPLPQTAVPVQFNQVLNTLDRPTRASLRSIIARSAVALGKGAAHELGAAAEPAGPALRDTAALEEALRGTRPHDVSALIAALGRITTALSRSDTHLAGLLDGLDRTATALAAEAAPLARAVAETDRLLARAPAALAATDRALPPATALAAAVRPALRAAPPVLRHTDRLLLQLQGLVGADELPRAVHTLAPTVRELPTLEDRLRPLFALVAPVGDCVDTRVLPALQTRLDDGNLSTGRPAWQDLLHGGVGLASSSAEFDSNGPWIRYLYAVGQDTVAIQDSGDAGRLVAQLAPSPLHQRPTPLPVGVKPALRPDATCRDQLPADLRSRASGTPVRPAAKPVRMRAARSSAERRGVIRSALDALRRRAAKPVGR